MLLRLVGLATVLTAVVLENTLARATVPDAPVSPRGTGRARKGKGRKRQKA